MKRKQPETSTEALDQKPPDSFNKDYDKIIAALKVLGSGNYDDIAKFLQLSDANVVSRRMKEMRDMGLLVNTGEKTKTRRNRSAFVHTLGDMPKTDEEVRGKAVSFKDGVLKTSDPELIEALLEWQDKKPNNPQYIQTELL